MNWAKEGWRCLSKITKPHVFGVSDFQANVVPKHKHNPMIVSRRFGSGINHRTEVDHQLTRDFLVKLCVADRKMRNPRGKRRRKLVKYRGDGDPRWFSSSSVAEDGSVVGKGKRVLKQPPISQSVSDFLDPESPQEEEGMELQLNMNSIVGMTSTNSLKLWGTINGRKVIVFVDSGASHNFLSHDLVKELQMQPENNQHYNVEVAGGRSLGCQGICRGVELQLPTLKVVQDFFLFDFREVDVILGYEWLESLGKITIDFREFLIEIKKNGKTVEIRGDPALSRGKPRRKLVKYRGDGDPRWFSASSVAKDGSVVGKGKRVLKQPPISQSVSGFLDPESPQEAKVAPLLARSNLLITRDIEWANLVFGFEQENRYAIVDVCYPQPPVGFIREQSSIIARQLLRLRRPFVAYITDAMGNELFRVRRPFWWITSSIYAEIDGKEIGVVHRRWHLWRRIYDLYLGNKQFAVVENPGFWSWTFTLKDINGEVLAQIDRDWRGFGFEILTDAGQYVIRFGSSDPSSKIGLATAIQDLEVSRPLTLAERAVAVALAISLDNDYFSRHGGWGFPLIAVGE